MKERVTTYCVFWLFACLCISLFFNYKQYRDALERVETVRTITVSVKETTDAAPQPVAEKGTGVVHVPVKKVAAGDHAVVAENVKPSTDSLTLAGDSVAIPITQKVYSDSTYTAYVSGYMQTLDSIKVKTFIIHENVTTTKEVPRFRRWNVGLIGGYGYGFTSRQLEPFVGVGVTWSLFGK